jgi:hypothetical protein
MQCAHSSGLQEGSTPAGVRARVERGQVFVEAPLASITAFGANCSVRGYIAVDGREAEHIRSDETAVAMGSHVVHGLAYLPR